MSNPVAGDEMSDFCVAVIRGTNIPLVVLVKSNMDEATGDEVPMPTWAWAVSAMNAPSKSVIFFMVLYNDSKLFNLQGNRGSRYASLSPRRHAVRFTIPENGIYLKLPCLRFRPIPKESLGRSQRKRPRTVYKNVLHWSGHQDEQSAHELERQGRARLN